MRPDKAKIGGAVYKIVFEEFIHSADGTDRLFGEIQYGSQQIIVSSVIAPLRERSTVIHECLHGILEDRVIELKENEVEQLEKGIFQFIRDNKDLIKYIMEEGDE